MSYSAEPLDKDNEAKAEAVLSGLAKNPSTFTRWQALCGDSCGECTQCLNTRAIIAAEMLRGDTKVWEVQGPESLDPLGILRLSRIRPGEDAVLSFAFFDGRMSDKVQLLRELTAHVFTEQPDGWQPLKALRAETPSHARVYIHTLARIGFGGKYRVRWGSERFSADAIIPTGDGAAGDLVLMRLDSG